MRKNRWLLIGCLLVALFGSGQNRAVAAGSSSVFGGSLLELGEVTLTCGGGFPDFLCQFDFANSKSLNFALRARTNYNLGFPFWGFQGFLSTPLRIRLWEQGKERRSWSVALQIEPGAWMGGGGRYGFHVGFFVGVAGLVGFQASKNLHLYTGLETKFIVGYEAASVKSAPVGRDDWGLTVPIEFLLGGELKVSPNFAIFARLSIGPMIYGGNLGGILNQAKDLDASGVFRFWGGVIWRR